MTDDAPEFVWRGETLGEVSRVVVADNHVSTHTAGGDVKRIPRSSIATLGSILDELHRAGVPIIREDDPDD